MARNKKTGCAYFGLPLRWLMREQDRGGSNGNIANYTYAYDAASQIATKKLNRGSPVA